MLHFQRDSGSYQVDRLLVDHVCQKRPLISTQVLHKSSYAYHLSLVATIICCLVCPLVLPLWKKRQQAMWVEWERVGGLQKERRWKISECQLRDLNKLTHHSSPQSNAEWPVLCLVTYYAVITIHIHWSSCYLWKKISVRAVASFVSWFFHYHRCCHWS